MTANVTLAGPIGYRQFHLDKTCESHQGHEHKYDHTTIIIRGRVKVFYSYEKDGQKVEGESEEYGQGETIHIKKNVHHKIKALEDNTQYWCVFSHRDFDGIVCEHYVGNQEAYN